MSEYSELVKNFEKLREYIRDFYVYGFKVREEYDYKSARTYDNERRRIEGWLSNYVRWERSEKGKNVFLSVDSAQVDQNPFYAAWKSKSFTANDIMLHFFLLDLFKQGEALSADEVTNQIGNAYQVVFDVQTVRNKLKEYAAEGLLDAQRQGRTIRYALSDCYFGKLPMAEQLLDAVKFFSEAAPLGVIGSTILDGVEEKNDLFRLKHYFIVHSLEDGVLLTLLGAMQRKQRVSFQSIYFKRRTTTGFTGLPLKIFVSTQNGRRYVLFYDEGRDRFVNVRLDRVFQVKCGERAVCYEVVYERAMAQLNYCWGVSMGLQGMNGGGRKEWIEVTFAIDEQREAYVLQRIQREGRNGTVTKLRDNVFLFAYETYDSNEMMTWLKSFVGRILSVEGSNRKVIRKFYQDMDRLYGMYCVGEVKDGAVFGNLQ